MFEEGSDVGLKFEGQVTNVENEDKHELWKAWHVCSEPLLKIT